MKKSPLLIILLVITSTPLLLAQAGTLDDTFDGDGKLTTSIGAIGDQAFSVAIQPDGKMVVAGVSTTSDGDFTLVRYNEDGSLDNSFGVNGITITAIGSGTDVVKSVKLQSDGKIVAAGYAFNGTDNDFAVVRYNSDGSLDNDFGTNGEVTTAFGPADDYGLSAALQSDGKIIVAGYASNGNDYDFAVLRYNDNGTLDNDFGIDGKLTTAIGLGQDYAYSIALQPDNKIVVAGASHNGVNIDFAVVRYMSNGEPDNAFGSGGKVTTPIGSNNDFAYSVIIQPDTFIVLGGFAFNGNNNDFAMARYAPDGSPDNNFGTDGIVMTPIGTDYDYGNAFTLQSDGKIIAAGDFNNGTDFDFAVARYNTNGALDSTFGEDGKVTTSVGTGYDYAYGVAIQPDGKIVVVGSSESGAGNDFAVVRYLSDFGTQVINVDPELNIELVYPNPAYQKVAVMYFLKRDDRISMQLSDIGGRMLQCFINNEPQQAGIHQQSLNLPANLSAGSYYLTITSANSGHMTIEMVK